MKDELTKIYEYSLEEVMGNAFERYARTIIQDRALPDVRDGLKPVQRRILYSMNKSHNTFDNKMIKCAKAVGEIMGNYHPHGDSSIYEALVRMSQDWKLTHPLIIIQGNNGSIDGDPPAASRYTECKLSKISNELLKDIDKNTVEMAPNYSDTLWEPTVLPSKFPNLLVSGSTGISAGYATNIPPHNLGEIIDATIKRIEKPNCSLDEILEIVKGPDFPTGAIAIGKEGIRNAFETGKGKVIVKSKYEIVTNKNIKQMIITEIPYEINKTNIYKKADEIRIDKKIEGIIDVRDESDREGYRIVIDFKKDSNEELIVNYLLKNTDLQTSYNYNMVAIVNKRPKLLGLLPILDAYITFQKEVVTRASQFNLDVARKRFHIVDGLIKAIAILDQIIKTIRASKDKADAEANLVKEYAFTTEQAKAIVTLQLYRLTNMDVIELSDEKAKLELIIKGLEDILANENKLLKVIKDDLKRIKKEYAIPRKTEILDTVEEIKIDAMAMIPKEDCIVVVTNDGYIKRVSLRSYNENEETTVKEGDYVTGLYEMNTLDTILLFTDLGNYLYVPVYEIPDLKWKELGKHISNIIKIDADETIIKSLPIYDFDKGYITIFTQNGMVKKTQLSEFKVQRYSKPITSIKLKSDDKVVSVTMADGSDVFVSTKNGLGLRFSNSEISAIGLKASGVKAINLKNDEVVSAEIFDNHDYLTIITDKKTGKRIKLSEFEKTSRARKGILMIRDVKTNPYHILKTFIVNNKAVITLKNNDGFIDIKLTDLPITDRYSTGTVISKSDINECFIKTTLSKKDDVKEAKTEEIPLEQIDEKIMTIDDFLDDFKLD